MSTKSYLLLAYSGDQEPFVVRPSAKGETHFTKKEAQRQASALLTDGIASKVEVADVLLTFNKPLDKRK